MQRTRSQWPARLLDSTGEWEIIGRPYTIRDGSATYSCYRPGRARPAANASRETSRCLAALEVATERLAASFDQVSSFGTSGHTAVVSGLERHRRPPLASLAPHQPRSARDAARALERRAVAAGEGQVQEGPRAEESDTARRLVQLAVVAKTARACAVGKSEADSDDLAHARPRLP